MSLRSTNRPLSQTLTNLKRHFSSLLAQISPGYIHRILGGKKKIPGVSCWRDFSWKDGNEEVMLTLAN